jgi:hypothetical protein
VHDVVVLWRGRAWGRDCAAGAGAEPAAVDHAINELTTTAGAASSRAGGGEAMAVRALTTGEGPDLGGRPAPVDPAAIGKGLGR